MEWKGHFTTHLQLSTGMIMSCLSCVVTLLLYSRYIARILIVLTFSIFTLQLHVFIFKIRIY